MEKISISQSDVEYITGLNNKATVVKSGNLRNDEK